MVQMRREKPLAKLHEKDKPLAISSGFQIQFALMFCCGDAHVCSHAQVHEFLPVSVSMYCRKLIS